MNLFDPVMLFEEGKKKFTDFALPDAGIKLWEQFFAKEISDRYYRE
jgi:hypothetical protein